LTGTNAGGSQQNRSFKGTAPSPSSGARSSASGGEGSTIIDGFSFSSSEADRQLAKSEAQRDFDARLEQERAGKDFADRGQGRRW